VGEIHQQDTSSSKRQSNLKCKIFIGATLAHAMFNGIPNTYPFYPKKKFVFMLSYNLLNGRCRGVTRSRVNIIVPAQLEIFTKLLAQCCLHGFQHVGENTKVGWVGIVVALSLVNTGAHQARVPSVHVSAHDITRGVVTDHVDVLWQAVFVVDGFHPAGHDLIGILVGGQLGLSVNHPLKLDAGDGFVNRLQCDSECALRHTRGGVLGWAEQIALGEVDWDSVGDGVLSTGSQDSVLRLEQVHDDLQIRCVVARV